MAHWTGFFALLAGLLALDLVLLRRAGTVTVRGALLWSLAWIVVSLGFGAWVWHAFGAQAAVEYTTGWLIEKALSIENIFVFALVFGALGLDQRAQQRVLPLGILGAIVLRGGVIAAGTALLARFDWVLWIFGASLVWTGVKLFRSGDAHEVPLLGVMRRLVPSTARFDGDRWTTLENGRRLATPLLLALLLVGVADAVFALDSVPAVLAVTDDPFLVFTSNAFAILGLRALYFAVATLLERLPHLKKGLAGVLVFVGAKMALADVVHLPPLPSLLAIVAILGVAVAASLRQSGRKKTSLLPKPS